MFDSSVLSSVLGQTRELQAGIMAAHRKQEQEMWEEMAGPEEKVGNGRRRRAIGRWEGK